MGVLNTTWKHIRRSPYQALAAILVMTLMFVVGGLLVLLSVGSSRLIKYFEQKPEVIVFFQDTKKMDEIKTLEANLKNMPEVASVKFVTKEEALEIYREQFKNDPLLLEMVSADILPASLEVSAVKITDLPSLASTLKKETGVADIAFPEEVVSLLVSWISVFKKVGLSLVVFLSLTSLFTVITVIGMKIALKKDEIEILQLVGATSSYIKLPFLTEGVIYGLIGALFGVILNLSLQS